MNPPTPRSANTRRALGAGAAIALLAVAIASPAHARPVWQYSDGRLIYGEPTNGEAYYPAVSCAAGRLTIVVPLSEVAAAVHVQDGENVDARGRPGPWPVNLHVSSGQLNLTVLGELEADPEGYPEASGALPAASPMGQAVLSSGLVDASVRGESMHTRRIPPALLARLAADCNRAAPE